MRVYTQQLFRRLLAFLSSFFPDFRLTVGRPQRVLFSGQKRVEEMQQHRTSTNAHTHFRRQLHLFSVANYCSVVAKNVFAGQRRLSIRVLCKSTKNILPTPRSINVLSQIPQLRTTFIPPSLTFCRFVCSSHLDAQSDDSAETSLSRKSTRYCFQRFKGEGDEGEVQFDSAMLLSAEAAGVLCSRMRDEIPVEVFHPFFINYSQVHVILPLNCSQIL